MMQGTKFFLATALLLPACLSHDDHLGDTEASDDPGASSGVTMPSTTDGLGFTSSTTDKPSSTTDDPGPTTEDPGSTTGDPVSTTGAPGSTTEDPGSTTEDPGSTTEGPVSTTEDPGSTTEGPVSTTEDPGSTTEDPGSTTDDPGSTTGDPGGDPGIEGFGNCNADPMACIDGEICLTGGVPAEVSVCGLQHCVDEGDCPDAPPGGDAPVACEDLTGDVVNECFIDCSAGQTCPDGMECFADIACAWPVGGDPAEPGFGNCGTDPTACVGDEVCATDGDPQTLAVCLDLHCADQSECLAPPPGGDAPVVCSDVTGDGVDDCHIDCSDGQTCPTGMECFAGFICAWPVDDVPPPPPPADGEGFGDCLDDPEICLDGEICLVDDAHEPTVGVCGVTTCDAPADCPDLPPGGDAPVACEEILGDGDGDCFIDCSTGLGCPTGMECAFDLLCVWPGA